MFLNKAINIFKKREPLVLVFMRHGADYYETGDLLPSGIRGVKEQGARLSEWFIPDVILSSDAKRAVQTAEILSDVFAAKAGAAKLPVHFNEGLAYKIGRSTDFISKTLPRFNVSVRKIFAASHCETVKTNIKYLTERNVYLDHAGTAVFKFDARRWADISKDNLIEIQIGDDPLALG